MANKKTLDTQNKTADTKKPKVAKAAPNAVPKVTKAVPKVAPKAVPKAVKVAKAVPKADTKKPKAAPKAITKVAKADTKKPKTTKVVSKAAKAAPKAVSKVVSARVYNIVRKPLRKSRQSSRQKVIKMYMVKMKIYGGGGNNADPEVTSLEGRIVKYKIITGELKPDSFIKSCLIKDDKNYKVNNNTKELILSKKEGASDSDFGDIFSTKYKIKSLEKSNFVEYEYEIISKLMKPAKTLLSDDSFEPVILEGNFYDNRNNEIEKNLMITITKDITSNKTSKHFLLMYFHSICDDTLKPIPKLQDDLPVSIVMYTEPATGDIRHLFENSSFDSEGKNTLDLDDDIILNILIQAIISIGTFHNTYKYIHSDCHMGNFLYQNNSEKKQTGYYSYSLGKTNQYSLKSCDYNIMIYDFGKSIKINMDIDIKFELYAITNAIIEGIIRDGLVIYFKDDNTNEIITYDRNNLKADNIHILNSLIKNNIKKCINELIKLDYILLINKFKKELEKYQLKEDSEIIKYFDDFIKNIKNINIIEDNIDNLNIFREVIQILFQYIYNRDIFYYGNPDESDYRIINSDISYKI